MTRVVHVVTSERPDHIGLIDIETTIVAIFSTTDLAERFAERYQRQVGKRLIVSIDEWELDSPVDEQERT